MTSKGRFALATSLWLIIATLVLGAAALASSPDQVSNVSTSIATSVTPYAADTGSPPGNFSTEALSQYISTPENPGAAQDLLPAQRWATATGLYNKISFPDSTNPALFLGNSMSVLFFGLASFVWSMLLTVLNWAFTLDLVTGMTTTLNTIASDLASNLWASGILAILGLVVLVIAAKSLLSGRIGKMFSVIIAFVIPLAGLQVLASGFASGDESPPLSPTWIVEKGSYISNEIGSGVLLNMSDFLGYDGGRSLVGSTDNPNAQCVNYTAALYDNYRFASQDQAGLQDEASVLDVGTQAQAMIMSSSMWESGYLNMWIAAQYNNFNQGQRMFCTQLEMARGTTTEERYAVVGGIAPKDFANEGRGGVKPSSGPFAGWGVRPFTYIAPLSAVSSPNNRANAQVFAWAACKGGEAMPGWNVLGDEAISDEECAAWAFSDGFDKPLVPDGSEVPEELFSSGPDSEVDGDTLVPGDPSSLDQAANVTNANNEVEAAGLRAVQDTQSAFWGYNAQARVLHGSLALLGAGLYGYSIGVMAVGVIIAQVFLVLMLALLPVTLLLAALPSQRAGSNPGWRLLKMTAAALFAKVVLLFILTVLLLLTTLITSLDVFGGESGFGLISALAPLAAFIALKFALKNIGLGSIMSPGGALGLTSGAALQAVGESKAGAGMTGAGSKGILGQSPLETARSLQGWKDSRQSRKLRKAHLAELTGKNEQKDGAESGKDERGTAKRTQEIARQAQQVSETGKGTSRRLPGNSAVNGNVKSAKGARAAGLAAAASVAAAKDNLSRGIANQRKSASRLAKDMGLSKMTSLTGEELNERDSNFRQERDLGADVMLSGDALPTAPLILDGAKDGVIGSSGELHAGAVISSEMHAAVSEVAANMRLADNGAKGDLENYIRAAYHSLYMDLGLTDVTGAEFDLRAALDISPDFVFEPGESTAELQKAIEDNLAKYGGDMSRVREVIASGAQEFLKNFNPDRIQVEIAHATESAAAARQAVEVRLEGLKGALTGDGPAVSVDSLQRTLEQALSQAGEARRENISAQMQQAVANAVSTAEKRSYGAEAGKQLEDVEKTIRGLESQVERALAGLSRDTNPADNSDAAKKIQELLGKIEKLASGNSNVSDNARKPVIEFGRN